MQSEQPLRGMKLQEKEAQKVKSIQEWYGNRKVMQFIRITMSRPSFQNKEVEPVQPVQINIYQSNAYRKDLSWLHFHNVSKLQDRQQVKDQQSCISVFVAFPTTPSSY